MLRPLSDRLVALMQKRQSVFYEVPVEKEEAIPLSELSSKLNEIYPGWRTLKPGTTEKEAVLYAYEQIAKRAGYTPTKKFRFRAGTRVSITSKSGFSAGSKGTVQFHDPNDKVWVLRDGASSAAFFLVHELEVIPDEPLVDLRDLEESISRNCGSC